MGQQQVAADVGEAREDRHAPRPMPRHYLLTTPVQHYSDQAKLVLFDELVAALKDAKDWNLADIRGFEDIQPNIPMLRARAKLLRDVLAKVPG